MNDINKNSLVESKEKLGKLNQILEGNWSNYFHVMASKDNEFIPKYKRELFDSPLEVSYQKESY